MNEFQLETAFKDLNLGQNFSAAKNSLRNFKEKIDEFKSLKSDDLFLQEYFARLRNEIDTEREAVQLRTECYYSMAQQRLASPRLAETYYHHPHHLINRRQNLC